MNNRNPNKENTYTNLGAWCAQYHEASGIKIHPSSVPYDLVLEDVLGYIAVLVAHDNSMCTAFDALNERVKAIEESIEAIKTRHNIFFDRFIDLERRVEDILLNAAAQVVKETKKVK